MKIRSLLIALFLSFSLILQANVAKKFDTEFLIHVKTYDTSDEKIGHEIKEVFAENMDIFQQKMKQFPDIHVFIRIAPDDAMYKDWTRKKGKAVEFSEGFTKTRTHEIFLRNPGRYGSLNHLHQVILHEYIHLFINYYYSDAPLWFHEGMAVWLSEGLTYERYYNFMRFFAFKQTNLIKAFPFSYPDNITQLEPYYFQSAQAVKALLSDHPKAFESFWDRNPARGRFEEAFMNTFLMTPETYLNHFDKQVQKLFYNGLVFIFLTLIWSLLPVVMVLAVIRKHRKNKKILAEWANDDEMTEDDYILEESEEKNKDE